MFNAFMLEREMCFNVHITHIAFYIVTIWWLGHATLRLKSGMTSSSSQQKSEIRQKTET